MKLFAPVPNLGNRWIPWLRALYLVFAVAFSLTVVVDAFVHETIMLGPGLVDDGGSSWSRLHALLLGRPDWFVRAFAVLAGAVMLWNAVMTFRGYDPADRDAPSPRDVCVFLLMNAVFMALLYASLALIGGGMALSGHTFAAGFDVIATLTTWCQSRIARVPVLYALPYPLPLLAGLLLVDLFHYWFHRLGHTWRPFWLLWHRPHHMTPYLTIPTTQPVFVAFPLFVVLSVPFQLGVGIAAKLFYSDSMIADALVLRVIGQIAVIGSHNSALYGTFWNNRVLRALSAFYGEGPYHYVHHSALPEHSLVNLGATPFMFWDRVFGTYAAPTATRVPVGLRDSPRLHRSPLRLALAGVMQIGYELKANRDWGTRWRVLFGSSEFTPTHTRDFALEDAE